METLANKYRPQKLEEVIGQDVTTTILAKQLEDKTFKNAYLFVGHAGCGKTTVGRILAKEINGGNGQAIEIDAASNNGAEDVRKLVSESGMQSITSEYRVYLIDECHAYSNAAWQAMLKILEESPAKTIFILCTTDPQKIPATVLSRLQIFKFNKIPANKIRDRLLYVLEKENIKDYDNYAIDYIANFADGGMRNALTYLDKVLAYGSSITLADTEIILGGYSYKTMFELFEAIISKDNGKIVEIISEVDSSGDVKQFIQQFFVFVTDIQMLKFTGGDVNTALPSFYEDDVQHWANCDISILLGLSDLLLSLISDLKYDSSPKYTAIARLLLFVK